MPEATTANTTEDQNSNIDEGLYSRQLYVLGHDAMHRMRHQNVLITSCTGLGVEVAKNLILAGLQSVTIIDNEPITKADFGTNFFLYENEDAVSSSKKRLDYTIPRLNELNPHCKVSGEKFTFDRLISKKQSKLEEICRDHKITIIVVVDEKTNTIFEAESFCISRNLKLISANSMGLFGFVMNNFGKSHEIIKSSDAELATGILQHYSLTQESDSSFSIDFTLIEETKHNLNPDDLISLKELPSNLQPFFSEPVLILKTPSLNTFTIKLPSCEELKNIFKENPSNQTTGRFEQLAKATNLAMQPLKQIFSEILSTDFHSKVLTTDFTKMDRTKFYVHFLTALNKLKEPIKAHKSKYTKNVISTIPNELLKEASYAESLIRNSNLQLTPINSVIGGLASQEVLKAASCKFKPIDQIMFLDFTEIGPTSIFQGKAHLKEKLEQENTLYRPLKSREDNLLGIFGSEVVQKFKEQKGLMVGAGAIGCEILKNVALLGLFNKGSDLIIIDNDTIERSNLNRQFLFREKDIEKAKSTAAKEATLKINPNIEITSQYTKFDEKYEGIDELMKTRNLLFAALDNIDARLFLDTQALFFGRPLFDSGTLGLRGNCAPIIPHLTENYGASRDPEEKAIPACTLKHYPYKPEHVVHWARDLFDGEFRAQPEFASDSVNKNFSGLNDTIIDAAKRYINYNVAYLEINENEQNNEELVKGIVKAAVDLYTSLFRDNIKQLLYNFPKDAKTSSGGDFWSGSKRCPEPVEFDYSNKHCKEFVEAAVYLKCEMLNIPKPDFKNTKIEDLTGDYKPKEFKVDTNLKIPENDAEQKENNKKEKTENALELTENDKRLLSFWSKRTHTLEFEKDDDKNGHIKFIAAASNLRAQNYRIGEGLTWHEVKKTAGRIVPAIATTTAIVAGLAVIESIKYINDACLDDYKATFLNLSIPMFVTSSPVEPKKTKLKVNKEGAKLLNKKIKEGETKVAITPWDKIVLPLAGNQSGKDLGIEEIKESLEDAGWKLSMLTFGTYCLFSFFMSKEKVEERNEQTIVEILMEEKVIEKMPQKGEFIRLEVFAEDENGEDVELPTMALRI